MKVPSFNEFLTEQTDSKLKILVLSDEPENAELYHTAKRIKDEGPKLGHDVYVVFIDGAYIKNENNIKKCLRRLHTRSNLI